MNQLAFGSTLPIVTFVVIVVVGAAVVVAVEALDGRFVCMAAGDTESSHCKSEFALLIRHST